MSFLPILAIILEAIIEKIAVPTMVSDVGSVANNSKGERWRPTMPLINTVTGPAEKENTCAKTKINKFLFENNYK